MCKTKSKNTTKMKLLTIFYVCTYFAHFTPLKGRSSHRRCSMKKTILKNFVKFIRTPYMLRTPALKNICERLLLKRRH